MPITTLASRAAQEPPSFWAQRRMRRVFCLDDFEPAARRHLPASIFAYVHSPSETGHSLQDNRDVFREIRFVPRILRDVSQRSTAKTLFGQEWSAPFGISPMAVSALTAYQGDRVLAESAAAENIPMVMSGSSLTRIEEVLDAAPNSWFQAYLPPTTERIAALVQRAQDAGFRTLVVTVDVAVRGSTEHYERAHFHSPLRPGLRLLWEGLAHPAWSLGTFGRAIVTSGLPHFENSDSERRIPVMARNMVREFSGRAHLAWDAIEKIRTQWKGTLVLKGILHPHDALRARQMHIDGIILSNHGGRQLDGAVSPMRVLPAVRAAVGDLPVMIDSGFRRGTDVIKALALGADFVFVGRPFNYAASVGAHAGVRKAAQLLKKEIDGALGMLGVTSPDQLNTGHVMVDAGAFARFEA
jgi:L-lactate dehydrogenase (cytochrome)